jgi:hypothetical protein
MIRLALLFCLAISTCSAQSIVVLSKPKHFRNADPQEWSEFPKDTERQLSITFKADNASWPTLQIRQRDVKQNWRVTLNDKEIGFLTTDEKDITTYLKIPAGALRKGANDLRITTSSTVPDDIVVGPISVYAKPLQELASASLSITVNSKESSSPIPARITILDESRSMSSVIAISDDQHLAIRPGCVYTSTGKAHIGLLPGRYTVFANRGFEYGVDSVKIELRKGDNKLHSFSIGPEVDTRGWIASDTHVHTLTHSGHGDATDRDRVITLAGEGIELPVITDHNIHIDLGKEAAGAGVSKWFTPVSGNEVTTKVGHFNVFPVQGSEKPVDYRGNNWNEISSAFRIYTDEVIILNHANDIHNEFRPFDPSIHMSSPGYDLNKWTFPANAMEVMNSGSQQSDIMKLFMNWFGMINGGHVITPVGSSDSHDVSRYIVGQGRTYVQGNDDDPAKIDVPAAVKNIRSGKVMVGSGLLTKIVVNGKYGPGELAPKADETYAEITVAGPSWAKADRVMLFANGELIREEKINSILASVKWTGRWKIDSVRHDLFLVAIATGPGNNIPFWPIEKPYQPVSGNWEPRLIGASGAVWLDGDGNGQANTANLYAGKILRTTGGNIIDIVSALNKYDKAVATQVAVGLWIDGKNLSSPTFLRALEAATPETKAGFEAARSAIKQAGK